MDLYVIRHAEAVALGEGIAEDADRPLTEDGIVQARTLAAVFQKRGISLRGILFSPLLRARQTAEEMVRAWGDRPPELRVCPLLTPGSKRRKLSRYIQELGMEQVALVGHQPDLGAYTAWLMGSRRAQLDFAKSGVAYLRCEPGLAKGEATLVWLVTPLWFRESSS